MNTISLTAAELCKSADKNGFINTVFSVFGSTVNVSIPLSKSVMDADITELNFSVRSFNALKRQGVSTVRDLTEIIEGEQLICCRNLGRISVAEIKAKLLDYCYTKLTEKEKLEFFRQLISSNR